MVIGAEQRQLPVVEVVLEEATAPLVLGSAVAVRSQDA